MTDKTFNGLIGACALITLFSAITFYGAKNPVKRESSTYTQEQRARDMVYCLRGAQHNCERL